MGATNYLKRDAKRREINMKVICAWCGEIIKVFQEEEKKCRG